MKFPRIYHLPNSPGLSNDDKRVESVELFLNRTVVITEKLDGSNVCLSRDNVFARSHSGTPTHPSFDLLKAKHAELKYAIEEGIDIYCEWCYAVHSIKYDFLPDYLFVIAIRDRDRGIWLSYHDTINKVIQLKLKTAPFLERVIFTDEIMLANIVNKFARKPSVFGCEREGIVLRVDDEFEDLSSSMAKWVRKDHVQTDEHWMHKPIEKQKLLEEL